jgi:hypothetical protein
MVPKDGSVIDNFHLIKDLGRRSHAALLDGGRALAAKEETFWQDV